MLTINQANNTTHDGVRYYAYTVGTECPTRKVYMECEGVLYYVRPGALPEEVRALLLGR